jgi:ankyrin repeat protein
MSRQLPPRANLEHLRNEAKQRLRMLRKQEPSARLSDAQLLVAREYGFASWRQLKAAVDADTRERVFAAASAGDVETVRRALESGFNPGATDATGRTVHQLAKSLGHAELELIARQFEERDDRPADVRAAVQTLQDAAAEGDVARLQAMLDEHPERIDERGVEHQRQTALHKAAWRNRLDCVRVLLERGADVSIRDYGDNAYALHFAAAEADLAVVRLLVEAGSDVIGEGDDHHLGVLGWATCLHHVREDVAAYLLEAGACLNIWSAIALNRGDEVRRLVGADRGTLVARMSRNEHHRTPLHHAAAMNRPDMVRLLLELGADPNATDAAGATPLATAGAGAAVVALLESVGARIDLLAALRLGRHDVAERLLREDPARLGSDGADTIVLHRLVAERHTDGVRWLLEHGVAVNARRVLWDCESTALHVTAEHGLVDLARLLLDAGADPAIRDGKYEATALGWAEWCKQPALAALLRERGATT